MSNPQSFGQVLVADKYSHLPIIGNLKKVTELAVDEQDRQVGSGELQIPCARAIKAARAHDLTSTIFVLEKCVAK